MDGKTEVSQEVYQIFLIEALELLEKFSQTLVVLEKDSADAVALNELFRIAHSLKGNAGVVGHENIKEAMHAAEDLFDAARTGTFQLTSEEFDLLLGLGDETAQFLTKGTLFDHQDWALKLRAPLGKKDPDGGQSLPDPPLILNEPEKQQITDFQDQGKTIYGFELVFAQDAAMRAATAELFVQKLQSYGAVFKKVPSGEQFLNGDFSRFKVILVMGENLSNTEIARITDFKGVMHGVIEVVWRLWVKRDENSANKESEPAKRNNNKLVLDTIRVDPLKLEKLLNTVGDLISVKAGLEETISSGALKGTGLSRLMLNMSQFNQTLSVMQSEVMQLRMVPIRQLFNIFPRVVRDLAHKNDKEVELCTQGETTEIDKKVMELLSDPLTHLVRNAIDHGIETRAERSGKGKNPVGRIMMSAVQQGNSIVIEINDDGAGIDPEKVRAKAVANGIAQADRAYTLAEIYKFLFTPGFSTAAKITDISGRGVGLDVVKTNLEMINGAIDIESKLGEGTVFRLVVPLTLAIINTFLICISGQTYAVPALDVVENAMLSPKDFHQIDGIRVIRFRDEIIPLVDLGDLFYAVPTMATDQQPVVIIGNTQKKVGLMVEEFLEPREIMIKPVNQALQQIEYVSGVTVLGNGRVALILNTLPLLNKKNAV